MIEAELLIGQLRRQVQDLESLVNFLDGRDALAEDDYAYSHAKLRQLIESLRGLERFSTEREASHRLRAAWLN